MMQRWPLPSLLCASTLLLGSWSGLAEESTLDRSQEIVVDGAPTFRDVLDLWSVGSARISPDGKSVVYTVSTTEWENNRFDTEIWLALEGGEPFQLTRTEDKSSSNPRWSPDGEWIAFVADRGDKAQVYRIAPGGGEARQVTHSQTGVGSFSWSPDGLSLAYVARDEQSDQLELREEHYGKFAIEDDELRFSHLWVQRLEGTEEEREARRLTEGEQFTVDSFRWAPDGRSIAFGHRPKPQVDFFPHADISIVDVASGRVRSLVEQPGSDRLGYFSPDGEWLCFASPMGADDYYGNSQIARVPVAGGAIEALTGAFDEDAFPFAWTDSGIWFTASQKTRRKAFLLDPQSRRVREMITDPWVIGSVSLAANDERAFAYTASGPGSLSEVYLQPAGGRGRQITEATAQVTDWPLGSREVVEWTSRDGATIEGALFLPPEHDPSRPAPLLVVIHGGPTGTSRPQLLSSYVYPVTQWLARGAMVLMPNYRGSAGYGADFRALNVRNLGVGDAWDVLSGVDHLVEQGLADPDRLGAMGWSQGGYISAFLSTNSKRFRAISNGAGISDWMTYYVNTDIHGFTRAYLEATPWDDPEIYAKTSPITNIKNASTPTLIQHGENDARVPIPNAYELYQGLRDQNVPTRLIVYKDFGHGISRPKERLAAIWHNWQWFEKYLFESEVELPLPAQSDETRAESSGGR